MPGLLGNKTEKNSRTEAVMSALRFAVSSAAIGKNTDVRGQGGTSHGMVYGPTAYEEHAGMIPDKLDPKHDRYGWREHVLFWRLDALSLLAFGDKGRGRGSHQRTEKSTGGRIG